MGEPVDAYLLYVNQQQVPEIFETLEEAIVAAKPYMQNQATLQIKTTWGRSAIGIINMILSSGRNYCREASPSECLSAFPTRNTPPETYLSSYQLHHP